MRVWWKKRESMLCWMNVNWMIVVKSGNMSVKVCRVCTFIVNVTDHDIN
jgi:hypothetical protein